LRGFRNLIERQILKAKSEGQLEGLEGEGQPLPDRSGEALVDPGIAAGMKIMAQAGVVPEELRLKAELDEARKLYRDTQDPTARKTAMARIADLEMRYQMARDARKSFLR